MLDVGTDSRGWWLCLKVLKQSRWFVCGFVCWLGILKKPTNSTKFGKDNIYWLVGALKGKGFQVYYGCQGKN
jgi:hypothetical protein